MDVLFEGAIIIKNEHVLVSAIVPVYNVGAYLKRCVESICAQTHTKIEIILVDDGSTDNSGELCDVLAVSDSRIKVIHKENAGLGIARNSGIDIATGEWLVFIDSDDFVHECFIKVLLNEAVNNNCLIAFCKFQTGINDTITGVQPTIDVLLFDWRDAFLYCLTHVGYNPYSVCKGIYHNSLFSFVRFQSFKSSEDAAIMPVLLWEGKNKQIALTNQVLYYNYQRPQSLSRGQSAPDSKTDQIKAFKYCCDFLSEKKEIGFANVLRARYFYYMAEAYMELRRDVPEKANDFEHLRLQVLADLPRAKRSMDDIDKMFLLSASAVKLYDDIKNRRNRYILYGYGDWGKSLIRWLKYWDANIIEIWDNAYKPGNDVEGIPINPMREGLGEDVIVLIALRDESIGFTVRAQLNDLGYPHVLGADTVQAVVRYGKYVEFLPEFLEGSI